MIINGIEYHLSEQSFEHLLNSTGKYAYFHNHDENVPGSWYNKNNLRVYNHHTNEHYYLERVWPNVGDNNLLFLDFSRNDGPTYSWCQYVTQHANVSAWMNNSDKGPSKDFVRFTIDYIDKDNFCKVSDGYNKNIGWYARGCFYKILKVFKV
ncbi:MAG: hypothetical protein E6R13_00610 [Spirochaetes bacterium]|nr:MAG: hypothetical protein E6R13_00610 [Spirochaetota bacterium]